MSVEVRDRLGVSARQDRPEGHDAGSKTQAGLPPVELGEAMS
jgi:hypothetical protein